MNPQPSAIPTRTELIEQIGASEKRLSLALEQEFQAEGEYHAASAALVIAIDEARRTTPDEAGVDELTASHRQFVNDVSQTLRGRILEVRLATIQLNAVRDRVTVANIAGRNTFEQSEDPQL